MRVLGEVTAEKLAVLREADAIFREEIAAAELSKAPDQYFAGPDGYAQCRRDGRRAALTAASSRCARS